METISVNDFKAILMKMLKRIKRGSAVDNISRGKIIARIVLPDFSRDEARKKLKELGKSAMIGEIVSTVDVKWNAAE